MHDPERTGKPLHVCQQPEASAAEEIQSNNGSHPAPLQLSTIWPGLTTEANGDLTTTGDLVDSCLHLLCLPGDAVVTEAAVSLQRDGHIRT